jgi:putative transport protein
MEHAPAFLPPMSAVALAMTALALSGALGLGLGALRVGGVGLGIGGVLFASLGVGHLAAAAEVRFDDATLEFVREFGLILFVYTIGVQVGPGFFASFRRAGLELNLLAAAIVLLGVATAVAIHFLLGVEAAALVGVMSGAVTNTPGLGAATQALKDAGADAATLELPSLGYAVAYPFGILGILLAMLLARAVFRVDVAAEAAAFEAARRAGAATLPAMNVRVVNPNLDGLELGEVPDLFDAGVVASRMLSEGRLVVPTRRTRLRRGDVLHLVGPAERLRAMRLILGEEADVSLSTRVAGAEIVWERIAATETRALGRRLGALDLEESHGVRISRVNRAGAELVASDALALQFGDIVTVVGPPEGVAAVKAVLGDQRQRLQEVQYAAVFVGIALGVFVGSLPIFLPGLPAPLKLGLAGGPLLVAIALARLGQFGPLVWFMPPVANHALRELGIVLFLAVVGLRAGDRFLATLVSGEGLTWLLCGAAITLVPLLIVAAAARLARRLDYLSLCGLLAGSMTDPPALAFANALAPSAAPSLAYATVYPLVMCLRILAPQLLVLALF